MGGGSGGLGMDGLVERVRDVDVWLGVVFAVALGERVVDPLLLVAGGGELAGVLERAGELVAAAGGLAERLALLLTQPLGELGEMLDAVLELAHERQTAVAQAGALDAGRRGGQPVERQLGDRMAEVIGADLHRWAGRRARRPARAGRRGCAPGGRQRLFGVGARGYSGRDGHREPLAARVPAPRDRRVYGVDLAVEAGGAVLGAGDRVAEGVVAALPGSLQPRQTGCLGVCAGLLQDERVSEASALTSANDRAFSPMSSISRESSCRA